MKIKKSIKFDDSAFYSGCYDEPSKCPLCKCAIKPETLHLSTFKNDKNEHFITALYLCHSCYQTFTVLHHADLFTTKHLYESNLLYIGPIKYTEEKFDDNVCNLSPQFVKIYNQALAAESNGLDEIAGLGYRKAMEFLVKDFCIHQNPDSEGDIKKMPLAQCISKYIDSDHIQTLATRAAWIGNDEAHYIRKHEERDVSDMKNFIKAVVYFIGMVLITEDAASMSPA